MHLDTDTIQRSTHLSIDVLDLIDQEYARQLKLKAEGRFAHTCEDPELSDAEKLAILAEEFGEAARAVLEKNKLANDLHGANLKKELVQVAAVAAAWIQGIENQEKMDKAQMYLDNALDRKEG